MYKLSKNDSEDEKKTKTVETKTLRNVEIKPRNSVLSELMKDEHIAQVYNICMCLCLQVMVLNFVDKYNNKGIISFGQDSVAFVFKNITIAWAYWIVNFLLSLICYPGFIFWAKTRENLMEKSWKRKAFDYCALLLLVYYYIGIMLYIPISSAWYAKYNLGSGLFSLGECMRMLMKCHAFVRTNAEKVVKYKQHTENKLILPKFKQYLYFLFAPTLIYQDEYPRTTSINWNKAFFYFIEYFVCIVLFSILIERNFSYDIVEQKVSNRQLLLWTLENLPVVGLLCMLFFYLFFEVWSNFFAEIFTFADREFYKKFWQATYPPKFLNQWNMLVYHWLYIHIYKDFYNHVTGKNVFLSRLAVLVISGIFHEVLLIVVTRSFIPVFFTFYVSSAVIFSLPPPMKHWFVNSVLLCLIAFLFSICSTFYIGEYFLRITLSNTENTWSDLLTPKIFASNYFY